MRAVSRPLIGLLVLLFVAWLALFSLSRSRTADEPTARQTGLVAPRATTTRAPATWESSTWTTPKGRATTPRAGAQAEPLAPTTDSTRARSDTLRAAPVAPPPRDPDGMNPRSAAGALLFLLILLAVTGGGKK